MNHLLRSGLIIAKRVSRWPWEGNRPWAFWVWAPCEGINLSG